MKQESNIFAKLVFAQDRTLEKKAWYRILQVIHTLIFVIIILVSALTFYYLNSQTTEINATLVCTDGTKWSTKDPQYTSLELDSQHLCGLCTKRASDNHYNSCSYDDPNLNNSYRIDREEKPTYGIAKSLVWTVVVFAIGGLILKILLMAIVYMIAGKREQESHPTNQTIIQPNQIDNNEEVGILTVDEKDKPVKDKKSIKERVVGWTAIAIGWVIGRALGLVFFILAIGAVVGYWFPSWYVKKNKGSRLPNFVAWLNLVSWLSPILGVTTAAMTYRFVQYADPKDRKKYLILATIAAVLAVGNALLYNIQR